MVCWHSFIHISYQYLFAGTQSHAANLDELEFVAKHFPGIAAWLFLNDVCVWLMIAYLFCYALSNFVVVLQVIYLIIYFSAFVFRFFYPFGLFSVTFICGLIVKYGIFPDPDSYLDYYWYNVNMESRYVIVLAFITLIVFSSYLLLFYGPFWCVRKFTGDDKKVRNKYIKWIKWIYHAHFVCLFMSVVIMISYWISVIFDYKDEIKEGSLGAWNNAVPIIAHMDIISYMIAYLDLKMVSKHMTLFEYFIISLYVDPNSK